jgi:asparagine synthase (glutamine-hydrolysing)
MCGIAGIIAMDGFEPGVLVAMTHLVSYRGPSGFGFLYSRSGRDARPEIIHNEDRIPACESPVIGMGSRRLAILDVSTMGSQPMQIDEGDYCITFNGEIYNYREIREELKSKDHRFKTGTDTEVLLHAYQEWGEDCVNRFNGMWSFGIWDRLKQRVFCSRDRFGIKPFYYAVHEGRFYFASEIKQILQASGIPRVANPAAVYNFLELGLVDYSAETFFADIQQLPGGHSLVLSLTDPVTPVIRRYWQLEIQPQSAIAEDKLFQEFQDRFEHAVALRLRSDVPVGFSLSGGIDSSAIVCQAKKIAPQSRFQTFSACFDEASLDERDYIATIISATGSCGHHTFPETEAFWKTIKRIIYHQDEPLGSTGVFAQWSVMEDAHKNGVPVILGGQGCDETFCGYVKYRYFYLWDLLRRGDPKFVRESILGIHNSTRSYWAFADVSRYFPGRLRRPFSVVEHLCTPEFRNLRRDQIPALGASTSVAERQRADLMTMSIPSLLHAEDRNSMAHSVESRLPFLDYKLAEFGVNCPSALKMHDGWSKWIVRSALTGTLPDKIRLRKTKLGFNTPEKDWVRHGLQNGQSWFWRNPSLRMERFLSAPSLIRECKKFLHGDPGSVAANWLFRAIELELWAKVHAVS